MKINNNIVGGTLDTLNYKDYANYLKSFWDYIKTGNVSLIAISMQNEPDVTVNYKSCSWNGTTLLNFVKKYAQFIGYPIMMAETVGQIYNIQNGNTAYVTHYVTSTGQNLALMDTISVWRGDFKANLTGQRITTFISN